MMNLSVSNVSKLLVQVMCSFLFASGKAFVLGMLRPAEYHVQMLG